VGAEPYATETPEGFEEKNFQKKPRGKGNPILKMSGHTGRRDASSIGRADLNTTRVSKREKDAI